MKQPKPKAIFNWSGGKDSSLALYHVLKDGSFNIDRLITTTNSQFDRVSMHGVRTSLLRAQSESLGLPIQEIQLPEMPSMTEYNQIMEKALTDIQSQGITHSIFGDIFLEDLKNYRDQKLCEVGLTGHYPLWKRDTTELIHEFIDLGFKTILVCIDASKLPQEFAGRIIDHDFIKDLPKGVDPCGENGEFHTFVFDGPIFKQPVAFTKGEVVFREYKTPDTSDDICTQGKSDSPKSGFYFQDLMGVE